MGRSYVFECPKCGYKARVSGRAERGPGFAVQTILCRDCKEIYDAVARLKIPAEPVASTGFNSFGFHKLPPTPTAPPAFESVVNRLPPSGAKQFRWVQFKLRCPVSLTHRVRIWNDPGKCPRCGVFLEKNALPFRIWE